MQKLKLLLAMSLLSLCSMQGVSAFSLGTFFQGFSNLFSRAKPTYNQNEPYYGLKTRDNIPHAIGIGAFGVLSASVIGVSWSRLKQKQAKRWLRTNEKRLLGEALVESLEIDVKNCFEPYEIPGTVVIMGCTRTYKPNRMSMSKPIAQESLEAIQAKLTRKAQEVKRCGLTDHDVIKRMRTFLQTKKDDETAVASVESAIACILSKTSK